MDDKFKPTNYVNIPNNRDGFFKRISQVEELYFLNEADVLLFHHYLLTRYGGYEGIRDEGGISYICENVEQKHEHLYQSAFSYLWYFVTRHPFNDGNKRLGAGCMLWFLESNGEVWAGNYGQLEYLIIAMAASKIQQADAFTYFLRCSGWVIP